MNEREALGVFKGFFGRSTARQGIVAGIVVFLLLTGSSASYAYWQATASLSAQAGSGTVLIEMDASSESFAFQYGPSAPYAVVAPVRVTNRGSVAVPLTVTFSPKSSSTLPISIVHVDIWSASECSTSGVPVIWTGTLHQLAVSNGPTIGTLASTGSVDFCVRTSMTSEIAAQNHGAVLLGSLVFLGTNGWVSSASVAVSQSVNVPPAVPGTLKCIQASDTKLTLSWIAPAGISTFRVVFSPSSSLGPQVVTGPTPATSAPMTMEVTTALFDVTNLAGGVGTATIHSVGANGSESAGVVAGVRFHNGVHGNGKLFCQ